MCLQPGEEIGNEVHPAVDQFFRIEQGEALFILNNTENHQTKDGDAVLVPAGTYQNVINSSKTAKLKLYTVYSPPNHPDKTVHKTKADAEKAEAAANSPKPPNAKRG
jgi:mannose-6-phosphate isomerase-like protein (cupin superfamily)